jgi:hypothetical protein
LQCHTLTTLIDIERVTALKTSWTSKTRLCDSVVKWHAMADEQVAGSHPRTKEPPVIATKDQMGVGDSSYLCWGTSVTGIAGNCERLWRYEFAETALSEPAVIVMKRVWIVHCLHPASNVIGCYRLFEKAWLHWHTHMAIEVGDVEPRLGFC